TQDEEDVNRYQILMPEEAVLPQNRVPHIRRDATERNRQSSPIADHPQKQEDRRRALKGEERPSGRKKSIEADRQLLEQTHEAERSSKINRELRDRIEPLATGRHEQDAARPHSRRAQHSGPRRTDESVEICPTVQRFYDEESQDAEAGYPHRQVR